MSSGSDSDYDYDSDSDYGSDSKLNLNKITKNTNKNTTKNTTKNKLNDVFENCSIVFEKNILKNDDIIIDFDCDDNYSNVNERSNIKDCQIRDSGFGLNYKSYLFGEPYTFGLVNLKVKKIDILDLDIDLNLYVKKDKHIYIVFSIDNSGSMSDICDNNKTKMDYIIHTLKNIIHYFIDNNIANIIISIYTFDSDISRIVYRTHINKENLEGIVSEINSIEPKGSTNIEYALQNSYDEINDYKLLSVCHDDIYHIFMTDGDANEGSTNVMYLSKYINTCAHNIFIGVGTAHNSQMLYELANFSNDGNYYIIDNSAKCGIVYGEIIYGLLYKCVKDFEINVENGYIYNWKTNKWCKNLYVGNLISDSSLTYYVITNTNVANCSFNVNLFGYVIKYDSIASIPICNIYYGANEDGPKNDDKLFDKHKYRQRVLDLLWNIRKYNDKDNFGIGVCNDIKLQRHSYSKLKLHLKKNMKVLFKQIRCFMKINDLLDDTFMKMLCDDIYIAYKSFNSKYSNMFTLARQMSQGGQRAYCGVIDVDNIEKTNNRFRSVGKSIDIYDIYNINIPESSINDLNISKIAGNNDNDNDNRFDYYNGTNESEDKINFRFDFDSYFDDESEDINKYSISNSVDYSNYNYNSMITNITNNSNNSTNSSNSSNSNNNSFNNCVTSINTCYATAQCIDIIANIAK